MGKASASQAFTSSDEEALGDSSFEHHTNPAQIAEHFEGYVPLVIADFGMVCELDILFLRPEKAGNIIDSRRESGDIDNRIKTVLDGLTMPVRGQVKLGEGDTPDPSPLYVLLQDDALVTSLRVSNDRLLTADDKSTLPWWLLPR